MKNSTITPSKTTLSKSKSVNAAERRRIKEAKARRKVNEDWQRVESSSKYRRAVAISICRQTTDKIADEVLDGILLNLNERNRDKPISEQKRLLRRIVEKRQAQAIHSKIKNSRNRRTEIAIIANSSRCMERLHYLRFVG